MYMYITSLINIHNKLVVNFVILVFYNAMHFLSFVYGQNFTASFPLHKIGRKHHT